MTTETAQADTTRVSPLYDPKIRGIAYQVVLGLVIAFFAYEAVTNAIDNLRAAKIASGFGFWSVEAGFDINQKLIPFSSTGGSTYGDAFIVGLLNTLLVAVIGIVLATILGFAIGIARLSKNWIVATLARVYVEIVRNTPLLLQLLFWYNAVLKPLPDPRNSVSLFGTIFLNNRGVVMPNPIAGPNFDWTWMATLAAIAIWIGLSAVARKRQAATGKRFPANLIGFGLLILLPLAAYLAAGSPLTFEYPKQSRFNLTGGMQIFPEFVALLLGLTIYTAAFIAENVRAGILAVSKGQSEAAHALGLSNGQTLRLIIVPQAMRVIIPPLTSQYLNLTKNSSLAVAIGYPDLVQVFTGTVLNQTGQAVEVIAITMLVYLSISLTTSLFMNIYNSRMALVER